MKHDTVRPVPAVLLALLVLTGAMHGVAESIPSDTIVLEGQTITTDSATVQISGTTATIMSAGVYDITGTLSAGQIIVDCDGDVTLRLNGASITSADGPGIDIQAADSVTITLVAGTENSVMDSSQYASAMDGQDAAIFSRADLVINGEGSLAVLAQYNDGIASRDTLVIEGGTIDIQATNHGVKGKDYLLITGGTLSVEANGDAIKATNDTQANMGYVEITGGDLRLSAKDDGISAITAITISGGNTYIASDNNGMKSDGAINIISGNVVIDYADDDFVCETKELSPDASITLNEI